MDYQVYKPLLEMRLAHYGWVSFIILIFIQNLILAQNDIILWINPIPIKYDIILQPNPHCYWWLRTLLIIMAPNDLGYSEHWNKLHWYKFKIWSLSKDNLLSVACSIFWCWIWCHTYLIWETNNLKNRYWNKKFSFFVM